jgi:AcrR family transcriptional regulator
MNDTVSQLISAASELFAENGYEGASVRAITSRAGANLGAITYHFGTKEALYDAVFETMVGPLPDLLVEAASAESKPLDRIEQAVRALFLHLRSNPSIPRLMMQHLASVRPLPPAVQKTLRRNISFMASLISEGQEDGSIRPGDATLMALSVGSQPIFLNLVRQALRESAEIDQDDPDTSRELVDSVTDFVRAGLASNAGER